MAVYTLPRICRCQCHQEARANYDAALRRHEEALDAYDANPVSPWTYRRLSAAMEAVKLAENVETVNAMVGADTDDVIEAASACPVCVDHHCAALLIRHIWGPRVVERSVAIVPYEEPMPDTSGEGAE
jgi:hypothetical protein